MTIFLKTAVALVLGLSGSPAAKPVHDFRWVVAEADTVILVDAGSISVAGDVRGFDIYIAADRTPPYGKGRLEADCASKRTRMLSHGVLNAAGGFDDVPEASQRWASPARDADELRMIDVVCAAPADRERHAPAIAGDWRAALDAARAKAKRGETPSR